MMLAALLLASFGPPLVAWLGIRAARRALDRFERELGETHHKSHEDRSLST